MDAAQRAAARLVLRQAGTAATSAIQLTRAGKAGAALNAWRALLGPLFPLT